MSSIAIPIERNHYQVMMEPPKDSQRIRMLLHTLRENALEQEDPTKRFFTSTGCAVLICAMAFFETFKFTGICLQTCIIEIWCIDFSEVKENLKKASENTVHSAKYALAMPFLVFAGMFAPEKVYSPLEYPFEEANALQLELERANHEREMERQRVEEQMQSLEQTLNTERANHQDEMDDQRQSVHRAEDQINDLQNSLDLERGDHQIEIGKITRKIRMEEIIRNQKLSGKQTTMLNSLVKRKGDENSALKHLVTESQARITELEKELEILGGGADRKEPVRLSKGRKTHSNLVEAGQLFDGFKRQKEKEKQEREIERLRSEIEQLKSDLEIEKTWRQGSV